MIREAHAVAEKTGAYITAQMENTHQLHACAKLADEIWEQTGGKIDAFVQSCGTSACLRGASENLRRYSDRVRFVAVEPAEYAILSGGPHKIDGGGAGYVVPLWNDSIADEIERGSTTVMMPRPWHSAWRAKKDYFAARGQERMSPRRFAWRIT